MRRTYLIYTLATLNLPNAFAQAQCPPNPSDYASVTLPWGTFQASECDTGSDGLNVREPPNRAIRRLNPSSIMFFAMSASARTRVARAASWHPSFRPMLRTPQS